MRIGTFGGTMTTGTIDDVVADARQAAEDGFATYWAPQIFALDALTVLAIVGREVPGIELGTAVVPTYPRHPWVLAQQALTVQAATDGRLALGIGLSHQIVVEGMWGISFAKPVRHLREYLDVLLPLSRGEAVSYNGTTVSAHGALTVPRATPFPILVAALGPQMLELTGRMADGTITWCVGTKTLESYTVPTLTAAAERAGRAVPRVVAALPVGVTADRDRARERAARVFEIYGQLPSYRAMLDREGASGPADIAIMGSEGEVTDRISALPDIGVTDFVAAEIGGDPDEAEATRELLRRLTPALA
jgi:5,10-methylenetetrahydromethanopterin reductase